MAVVYVGVYLFAIGFVLFLTCSQMKVPFSSSLSDMPIRIQISVYAMVLGILVICAGVMYVLVMDPMILLR